LQSRNDLVFAVAFELAYIAVFVIQLDLTNMHFNELII